MQAEYLRAEMAFDEMSMAALAGGTGGTFFHNSNDLEAGFKAVTQVPEYAYTLELSLDNVNPDGVYHPLRVKVDRKDVEVQAREGYFKTQAAEKEGAEKRKLSAPSGSIEIDLRFSSVEWNLVGGLHKTQLPGVFTGW